MSDTMADRFRKWFAYEQDAHAKVVRSLESVPAERRDSPEYQKAVGWLAHLAMARRIWLERLGVIPLKGGTMFPDKVELDRRAGRSARRSRTLVSLSGRPHLTMSWTNNRIQEPRRRSISQSSGRHSHTTLRALVVSSRSDRDARPRGRRRASRDGLYLLVS